MTSVQFLKEIMANNLKKQLKRKGKTQTMMAKDLNIPETTVSNWIKGKTYPRPDKIQLMADYFGVNRTQLTEELTKETPTQYNAEQEFVKDLELSDDELLEKFTLKLDGKELSDKEAKGVIAYLRSLRQVDQDN